MTEKRYEIKLILEWLKSVLSLITKNYIYTTKIGDIEIKYKGGLGFFGVLRGIVWELSIRITKNYKISRNNTPEEIFISNLDLKGKTIYDVGSSIGKFTIFFAKSTETGKVIAFEPNHESYIKLRENVELNDLDNVEILNVGLGENQEIGTLAVRRSDRGTGSMEKDIQSEILNERGSKILHVEVNTLDNCIRRHKLPKPDFIKIDIEGMEYNALMGGIKTLSKYKPTMLIEIHGANQESKIENAQRIIKFLDLHGYSIYHVESKQEISRNNIQIAKSGHLFCS